MAKKTVWIVVDLNGYPCAVQPTKEGASSVAERYAGDRVVRAVYEWPAKRKPKAKG